MHRNNFLRGAQIFAVLFAGIFPVPALRAQPTEQAVQSRFLFIFSTSSDMKNRVNAVQKALDTMLATSMSGQLHAGDSIGVWTFNQDLRRGDFPLQIWNPDDAAKIAANMTKFIEGQHYAKNARFEALQPLLNRVVLGSERLTVVIFCDGETKISGTPFDAGINQIFQEKLDNQKSARQPLVIVLRSQLGQYVNCTMGFPPQPVSFSGFPPLPEPPPAPPAPKLTNALPPPSTSAVPSLIIIGKKIESSIPPPQTAPTNLPPVVPLPVVTPVMPTNALAAPIAPNNTAAAQPTNQVAAKIIAAAPVNPPVPGAVNSGAGLSGKNFLIFSVGLLGAAIALGIILWLRLHRKNASLITRSMNDRR